MWRQRGAVAPTLLALALVGAALVPAVAAGGGRTAPVYARTLARLEALEHPTGLAAQAPAAAVGASALAALALAETGQSAPARSLWTTLARCEGVGGRWPALLSARTGAPLPGTGPSYSGLGLALAALYVAGRDGTQPDRLWRPAWPAAARVSAYLRANVGADGLGLPDDGPWQGGAFAYWAYSQGMYVVGLDAAGDIALALGHGTVALADADAAATIETTLETPDDAPLPGFWDDVTHHYDQAQGAGGGPENGIDASLTALWALGALPAASARAADSLSAIDMALGAGGMLQPYAGAPASLGPAVADQLLGAVDAVDLGQIGAARRTIALYRGGGGVGAAAAYVLAVRRLEGVNPAVPAPVLEAGAYVPSATTSLGGLPYVDLTAVARPMGAAAIRLRLADDDGELRWAMAAAPGQAGRMAADAFVLYVGRAGERGIRRGLDGGRLGLGAAMAVVFSVAGRASRYGVVHGAWRRLGPVVGADLRRSAGAATGAVPASALLPAGGVPASGAHLALEPAWLAPTGGRTAEVDLTPVRYRWTGPGLAPLDGVPSAALIQRLTVDRARYVPGEVVHVTAMLVNGGLGPLAATLWILPSRLGTRLRAPAAVPVHLAVGQARTYTVSWRPPPTDDEGYLLEAVVRRRDGTTAATAVTAADVSASWTTYPRYGYLTSFGAGAGLESAWTMSILNLYHLDALQFYDWQWQHGQPLAGTVSRPAPAWTNVAGVTNLRQSVLALIGAAHRYGMRAFEYDLAYGAWAQTVGHRGGPSAAWALYGAPGCRDPLSYPLPAGWQTPAIDLFDPASRAWQTYLLARERAVFEAYPFDGWQVDQLGDLGPTYTCAGAPVDLPDALSAFLVQAHKALGRPLIFNAVGGYAEDAVAVPPSPVAVSYIEAWPSSGQVTYADLRRAIESAARDSGGRLATIVAAYPDSSAAADFSDGEPGTFGAAGVRLLDAVIFASGGDHIELGDQAQMLSGPYFPSTAMAMSGSLAAAMLAEANFVTAYERALRGPGLHDLAAPVTLSGAPVSSDGRAGAVWAFARGEAGLDVVELINLTGRRSAAWNDPEGVDPAPPVLHALAVRLAVSAPVASVAVASPDIDGGVARSLAFAEVVRGGRDEVVVRVPSLDDWDTVLIRLGGRAPARPR